MTSRVRVKHPDGRAMPFSESLLNYLKNHRFRSGFTVGDWLMSLSSDELQRLAFLAEEWMLVGHRDMHLDMVLCARIAYEAESGGDSHVEDEENFYGIICNFCILVSTVLLSRIGLIELESKLSIQPSARIIVKITELGMQQQEIIQNDLH
jgi:hypothetical protein